MVEPSPGTVVVEEGFGSPSNSMQTVFTKTSSGTSIGAWVTVTESNARTRPTGRVYCRRVSSSPRSGVVPTAVSPRATVTRSPGWLTGSGCPKSERSTTTDTTWPSIGGIGTVRESGVAPSKENCVQMPTHFVVVPAVLLATAAGVKTRNVVRTATSVATLSARRVGAPVPAIAPRHRTL